MKQQKKLVIVRKEGGKRSQNFDVNENDERASFEGFTNQVISESNYYRFDHKSTSSRVLRQFYSYLICKTNWML